MEKSYSWYHPHITAQASATEGKGVFAQECIPKRTIIARFGGYVQTLAEEAALPSPLNDYSHQIDDDFVFGVREQKEIGLGECFNHSCDPNIGFKGQIFLMTMRDILAGEELVFDYAMVLGGNIEYDMECLCGSPICRKRVKAHDWKNVELQKRYAGYFQWYIQDKIDALKEMESEYYGY